MKVIKRTYARIYVDMKGETLEEEFFLKTVVEDYYQDEVTGFLQWNFYVIYPKGVVPEDRIDEVLNDGKYCRRLIVSEKRIGRFIEDNFPITSEYLGRAKVIETHNHKKTLQKKDEWVFSSERNPKEIFHMSFLRDLNIMDTLTALDNLRTKLIKNEDLSVIFVTHLTNEFSLAEKKLKIFIKK